MNKIGKVALLISVIFTMLCLFTTSGLAASQRKVEFGVLVKEILFNLYGEKATPSTSYYSGWDQLDNSKNYTFKRKDYAEKYEGTVRPLLVFDSKPAKEAWKRNVIAKWDVLATGSKIGFDKIEFRSSINDGAYEEDIVASLGKSGITARLLTCNEDKVISLYGTYFRVKIYRLSAKGYAPSILIISTDIAAQFASIQLIIIPNTSGVSGICR